jgi:hypothetical protein
MLTITSPATIFDFAEMSGATSRLYWAVAREMWANGDSWAIRDGDDMVALCGFYPLPDNEAEAWFNVRPELGRNMLQFIRAMRLTIAASPYRGIVTVCTSRAGVRIVQACGFSFVQNCELGELWKCHKSSVATAVAI